MGEIQDIFLILYCICLYTVYILLQSEDKHLAIKKDMRILSDDVLSNLSSIHGRIMEVENALTYFVEDFTEMKQMGENSKYGVSSVLSHFVLIGTIL